MLKESSTTQLNSIKLQTSEEETHVSPAAANWANKSSLQRLQTHETSKRLERFITPQCSKTCLLKWKCSGVDRSVFQSYLIKLISYCIQTILSILGAVSCCEAPGATIVTVGETARQGQEVSLFLFYHFINDTVNNAGLFSKLLYIIKHRRQ